MAFVKHGRADSPEPQMQTSTPSTSRATRMVHALPSRPICDPVSIEPTPSPRNVGYPALEDPNDAWVHVDRVYREPLLGWSKARVGGGYRGPERMETVAWSAKEVRVGNLWTPAWNEDLAAMKRSVWMVMRACGPIVGIHHPREDENEEAKKSNRARHKVMVHFEQAHSVERALKLNATYVYGHKTQPYVVERSMHHAGSAWVILPLSKLDEWQENARNFLRAVRDSAAYEAEYAASNPGWRFAEVLNTNSTFLDEQGNVILDFSSLASDQIPPEFDYQLRGSGKPTVGAIAASRKPALINFTETNMDRTEMREARTETMRAAAKGLVFPPIDRKEDGRPWAGTHFRWPMATYSKTCEALEEAKRRARLEYAGDISAETRARLYTRKAGEINAVWVDDQPRDVLLQKGMFHQRVLGEWRRRHPGQATIPRFRIDYTDDQHYDEAKQMRMEDFPNIGDSFYSEPWPDVFFPELPRKVQPDPIPDDSTAEHVPYVPRSRFAQPGPSLQPAEQSSSFAFELDEFAQTAPFQDEFEFLDDPPPGSAESDQEYAEDPEDQEDQAVSEAGPAPKRQRRTGT